MVCITKERVMFFLFNFVVLSLIPSNILVISGHFSCPYVLGQVLEKIGLYSFELSSKYGHSMNLTFFLGRTLVLGAYSIVISVLGIVFKKTIINILDLL